MEHLEKIDAKCHHYHHRQAIKQNNDTLEKMKQKLKMHFFLKLAIYDFSMYSKWHNDINSIP